MNMRTQSYKYIAPTDIAQDKRVALYTQVFANILGYKTLLID